jgi:hypothetical protein
VEVEGCIAEVDGFERAAGAAWDIPAISRVKRDDNRSILTTM